MNEVHTYDPYYKNHWDKLEERWPEDYKTVDAASVRLDDAPTAPPRETDITITVSVAFDQNGGLVWRVV